MAFEVSKMYKLVFTKGGIEVKKKERKALTGGEEWINIEHLNWEDLPRNNVEIKVTGFNYELSSDHKCISKLELIADYIKRAESQIHEVPDDFWKKIEEELGIKKENDDILLNPQKTAKQNLIDFVKYLFKHEYIKREDIPISSGYKWYLLNDKRVHKDGEPMVSPEEIEKGVYLETNYSRSAIKERIKRLAEDYVIKSRK